MNSSASTLSPSHPNTPPSNHGLAEGTLLPDLAYPALIHGPALSAPTSPSPVRPTPDPLGLDQSAPALSPSFAPRRNSVTFGTGIVEALPYATTAQAPYPPPAATPSNDLAATSKATTSEILSAPSFQSFLASKQQKAMVSLLKRVRHPAAALIQSYVEEGIPAHTGPLWSPQAPETAISKGSHT